MSWFPFFFFFLRPVCTASSAFSFVWMQSYHVNADRNKEAGIQKSYLVHFILSQVQKVSLLFEAKT